LETNNLGGARVEKSHSIACLLFGDSIAALASELVKEGKMDVEIDVTSLISLTILLKVVINLIFHLNSVIPHAIKLTFIINIILIWRIAAFQTQFFLDFLLVDKSLFVLKCVRKNVPGFHGPVSGIGRYLTYFRRVDIAVSFIVCWIEKSKLVNTRNFATIGAGKL